MLTFSCLYNEVLHKEKSPRHLYILLEAWLEMNKLIFVWQVAELKYVCNFCQKKCPISKRDPRNEKKKSHIAHFSCMSQWVSGLHKNSQNVYSRLFAKVLESCRGYTAFGFRVSRLKAILDESRQACLSLCNPWL